MSVSFDRAVKTMKMVEISENRNARDTHLGGFMLRTYSARERLCPGDTIIRLGRRSQESFELQANCGVYRYYNVYVDLLYSYDSVHMESSFQLIVTSRKSVLKIEWFFCF